MEPTPRQSKILSIPESFDVFDGAGRGAGKSTGAVLAAVRHIVQYGQHARVTIIRRTQQGAMDIITLCRRLFTAIDQQVTFNAATGMFRFRSGATCEIGILAEDINLDRYLGRETTLLIVDQAEQFHTPRLIDRMRTNLRGPKDIPLRTILLANAGGVGHDWICQRHVNFVEPWKPYYERQTARHFVSAFGSVEENPHVDVEAYLAQLRAGTAGDTELWKAWALGSWQINRGAYFGDVLNPNTVLIDPWRSMPGDPVGLLPAKAAAFRWRSMVGFDFGISAPAVALLAVVSPGAQGPDGSWYERDSIIILDEYETSIDEAHPNTGNGATISELASGILGMCERWGGVPASGPADDSIFARTGGSGAPTIAADFAKFGVRFVRSHKGSRIAGWSKMRQLFQNCGTADQPGLYITRNCRYTWSTLCALPRDERNPSDVLTKAADHSSDCLRYIAMYEGTRTKEVKLLGI